MDFCDLSDDEVIKADINKIHEVLGRANPPVNWDNDEYETDVFASESSDNYESDSDFAPNSNGACAVIARPDESSHSSFSDARAPSSLDEEVLIFDNNLPASDENCLHLNRLYQELLIENINQLQQLLAANREKQTELQDSLDAKLRHGKTRTTYLTAANVFAIPYFKDVNGYHSPLNADALAKALSKERDPSILPPRSWLPVDDKIFMDAIGLNAMQIAMQPIMMKKEELQMKLDLEVKEDEKATLALLIQEMDDQLAKITEIPASELIELHQEKDFDWLMISTGTFHGMRSATDCELYWNNCLHPSINRSEWSKEETERMKALAKKNKERDWDKVAEDLQTMRRGWQCFIKYQSDLNFLKRRFSPDDDKKLLGLVQNFATGSYIPWQQVCYHMDYFSKRQIRKRWTFYLDPRIKHGKWSVDEDVDLVKSVWKFGAANWRRFCIPGRTSKQCRARWLECLNPALSLEPFSMVEDNLLENLVQQYPTAWTRIARYFKGRSCSMVKTRWARIEGWRRKQVEKGIVCASTMFPPSRERTNKRHQHRGLVYRKLAAKLRVAGEINSSVINTKMWINELEEGEKPNDEQGNKDAVKAARELKRVRPRKKNNRRQESVSDRRLNEIFWVCQGMGRYRNNFELDPGESATDELHISVTQEIKKVMCIPCGSQECVTNFLAPNMSTLTAFRNLLLIRGRLRNLAKNTVCLKNRSHDDRTENNCKRFKGCNNEIEPREPDYASHEYHNLLANFCALFFWPAVFSGAAPKDEHLALKPNQTSSRSKPRLRERKRARKKPWVTQRMKALHQSMHKTQQDEVETNHTQQDDSQRPLPDQGGSSVPIAENVVSSDGPSTSNLPDSQADDSKRKPGRPLGSRNLQRKPNVVTDVRRSSRTKK